MCIKDRYTKQQVIDRACSSGIDGIYVENWLLMNRHVIYTSNKKGGESVILKCYSSE